MDDIHKAAKAWAALLGVPEPEIWTNHLKSNGEYPYTYRGKDVPCDLQMCVIDMGSWVLELQQLDHRGHRGCAGCEPEHQTETIKLLNIL